MQKMLTATNLKIDLIISMGKVFSMRSRSAQAASREAGSK